MLSARSAPIITIIFSQIFVKRNNNAYRIELKGDSMRKGKTTPSDNEN
jgi:hypothetical protein